MLKNRLRPDATPEQVYLIVRMIQENNGEMLREDLKQALLPDGKADDYFGNALSAALNLKLIRDDDGMLEDLTDQGEFKNMNEFRRYLNQHFLSIPNIEDFLLFKMMNASLQMNDELLNVKSITDVNMLRRFTELCELERDKEITVENLRAFRFWYAFMGLGYVRGMNLYPNMYKFLKDILVGMNIKNEKLFMDDFLKSSFSEESGIYEDKSGSYKLNYGFSEALIQLHKAGEIELSNPNNDSQPWQLFYDQLGSIPQNVTQIIVKGVK